MLNVKYTTVYSMFHTTTLFIDQVTAGVPIDQSMLIIDAVLCNAVPLKWLPLILLYLK
jgi:hypothetical protein